MNFPPQPWTDFILVELTLVCTHTARTRRLKTYCASRMFFVLFVYCWQQPSVLLCWLDACALAEYLFCLH